jgi:hypothetical protein
MIQFTVPLGAVEGVETWKTEIAHTTDKQPRVARCVILLSF